VCNNSPAESTSPENGWRWSVEPIPYRHRKPREEAVTSRRVAVVSVEAAGVRPGGAATGADLGGSSKYSSENLED
jgi:hypothetical protein